MPRCVLKFRDKILNKISKEVYFFVRLKDKEVFNYKINSFTSFKGIFQNICPHNHHGTFHKEVFFGTVNWVSELKLRVENQLFELTLY